MTPTLRLMMVILTAAPHPPLLTLTGTKVISHCGSLCCHSGVHCGAVMCSESASGTVLCTVHNGTVHPDMIA